MESARVRLSGVGLHRNTARVIKALIAERGTTLQDVMEALLINWYVDAGGTKWTVRLDVPGLPKRRVRK